MEHSPRLEAAGGQGSRGNRFDTNVACPRVDASSGIATWELKSPAEEGGRIAPEESAASNAGRRSFTWPSAIAVSQIGAFVFGPASDVSISSRATASPAALRRGSLCRAIHHPRANFLRVFCAEVQYPWEKIGRQTDRGSPVRGASDTAAGEGSFA